MRAHNMNLLPMGERIELINECKHLGVSPDQFILKFVIQEIH